MTTGVVIFAFDNEHVDYTGMAAWSAHNIHRNLDLPVCLITDTKKPNCAAFDQTEKMLNCIAKGIGDDSSSPAEETIDAGDLGYCKFLKFKCAAKRTCDAWVEGGPIT